MKLSPMKMSDAEKMLEWKNYDETRQFAIASHDTIKWADHYKWLKKNLKYFQIINDFQGAIRIQNHEVSIWVDREFRGQGLAKKVLKKLPQGTAAKIVDGNIASMRSFISAGFKPISYHNGYTLWKK